MKRNGFTLVELLAVIAILAILVIIALPNILGMFNDAREKSFTTEIKEMYKVAEQQWVSDSLHGTGEKVYSNTSNNECANKLDLSGRKNIEYYIRIDKSGKVVEYYATDGTYQYAYEGDALILTDINEVSQIATMDSSTPVISIACDCVNYDFPNGVEADPTKGPVFVVNRNKYYDNLSDALVHASSGQTIKLLDSVYEYNYITIPASVNNLKIDLNGQQVSFNVYDGYAITNNGSVEFINTSTEKPYVDFWYGFENNGTITFNAEGTISSENTFIQNNGTVNIHKGDLGGRESDGIINHGTVNMDGGKVGGYGEGVDNYGTFNMTGGTVDAYHGVVNEPGATMSVTNGSTLSSYTTALTNAAGNTLNISNSTIESIYAYDTFGIKNSGTLNLTNVAVNTATYSSGYKSTGILNYSTGTMTLNNVTITPATSYSNEYGSWSGGTLATAIDNRGTMTLNSTIITSISQKSTGITNSGVLTYKSGSVNQVKTGIEQTGGTFTLGTNDGTVSTTAPSIIASYTGGYGTKITGGTFNFYDGVIKGKGSGYSINGTVTNTPSGYTINKSTASGVESATLIQNN